MSYFAKLLCLAFPVIIAVSQPSAAVAQLFPSSRAVGGNSVHGIDLVLTTQSSAFSLGSPINIKLEIRNHSGKILRLRVPQLAVSYTYLVIDRATGKHASPRVPARSGVDVFSGFDMHIRSGESYLLPVRLDDLVQLDGIGSYSVTVSTINVQNVETQKDVGLTSNTITIDVVPKRR